MQLINWEESFLKQKSRCHWVKTGDQNTKFFFRTLQQRNARNIIKQLKLSNEDLCTDHEIIKETILTHYMNLLGTEKARRNCFDSTVFQSMLITTEVRKILCKRVTIEEIKEALWSIKVDKSLGPYGFNSFFFKKV